MWTSLNWWSYLSANRKKITSEHKLLHTCKLANSKHYLWQKKTIYTTRGWDERFSGLSQGVMPYIDMAQKVLHTFKLANSKHYLWQQQKYIYH